MTSTTTPEVDAGGLTEALAEYARWFSSSDRSKAKVGGIFRQGDSDAEEIERHADSKEFHAAFARHRMASAIRAYLASTSPSPVVGKPDEIVKIREIANFGDTGNDYYEAVVAALGHIEALSAEVARVTKERDDARAENAKLEGGWAISHEFNENYLAVTKARAEKAEAALAAANARAEEMREVMSDLVHIVDVNGRDPSRIVSKSETLDRAYARLSPAGSEGGANG